MKEGESLPGFKMMPEKGEKAEILKKASRAPKGDIRIS